MHTVRELMARLKADKVTIDEVAESLRARSRNPSRPRPQTIADSYTRAEQVPGDDDTFWIDVAYTQHVIKYHDYRHLVEALAAGRGAAARTSGGGGGGRSSRGVAAFGPTDRSTRR